MAQRRFLLAGVAVSLGCDSSQLISHLDRAWGHHSTKLDSDFTITCRIRPDSTAILDPNRLKPGLAYARHDTSNGFELRSKSFFAEVNLELRTAEISCPPELAPIQVLLRQLLPALVSDGIVLHAAGLAASGRGWVCTGPSGCGKSTLAALFPEAALCDELVAVRRLHEQFVVDSLPFWTSRATTVPLAGLHFLRHGPANKRTSLAPPLALKKLTREIHWPTYSRTAMDSCLAVAADLVTTIPCYELAFFPDTRVWPVLTSEASAA